MSDRFLDSAAAAAHVGYADIDGRVGPEHLRRFYDWASRHGVKKHYAGRRLRFKAQELDIALDPARDPLVERALQLVASHGAKR